MLRNFNNNYHMTTFQVVEQCHLPTATRGDLKGDENTRLIINYMPKDMDNRELFTMFARFGCVTYARVMRNYPSMDSRCFGFVNFQSPENAMLAQISINGRELRGKRLKVAISRRMGEASCVIYVGHVPVPLASKEKLFALFIPFGDILDVNIPVDKCLGFPYGVAFVRYGSKRSAAVAISAMNGAKLLDDWSPLIVRFSRTQMQNAQPPAKQQPVQFVKNN